MPTFRVSQPPPPSSYHLSPLPTSPTACVLRAARKVAPGVLQDDRTGERLRLTKTSIATLKVSGVQVGRVKVGVDDATGLAYAVKKFRLRDTNLSRERGETPAQTRKYLIDKMVEEASLGTRAASPMHMCAVWTSRTHVYGQMPLMLGALDGVKHKGLWGCLPGSRAAAPTPATVRAMHAVWADLQRLHGRGFAHCDIKPANIMHRNDPVSTLLGDYGLARPVSDRGQVEGTPRHMAPEQQRARRLHVPLPAWTRADVWGVGSSFLEVLVGNPFDCSKQEREQRLDAYARWHRLNEKSGKISRWRAKRVPYAAIFAQTFGALDPPWRSFFMRVMHPDPAQRPEAREARALLEQIAA